MKVLMVGAGLSNAVIANRIKNLCNYPVDVIDRNRFIGGMCYSENEDGIEIHKFGPHIFRTNNYAVWEFVNRFDTFNNFINCPIAKWYGKVYNLPFNMNTFCEIWDISTPDEAREAINSEIAMSGIDLNNITNLEEKAISMVGTTIYNTLVKDYTEKQWGRSCKELPPDIISRLPLRFTFDNNYSNARYQGIPKHGYTNLINCMFYQTRKILDTPFEESMMTDYDVVFYSGRVDELFNFDLGELEFRGVRWDTERIETNNYQGNAVVNYTSHEVPYTRIIEHKHFMFGDDLPYTYISKEYPINGSDDRAMSCYPVRTDRNLSLYKKYVERVDKMYPNMILTGRLGLYEYLDMDKVIERSTSIASKFISELR